MTHLAVVFNHHTPESLVKKLLKTPIMAAMNQPVSIRLSDWSMSKEKDMYVIANTVFCEN